MKTPVQKVFSRFGQASFRAQGILALFACAHQVAAQPVVSFNQPTNGQQIVTFTGLTGTAQPGTGTLQYVTFSIYDQSTGQWWNGTNFQPQSVSLPVILSGTNWTPSSSIALPAPCCGQVYQLAASATDTYTNTGTTNITVQADAVAPAVAFSSLSNGQTVSDLSALGGSVTDNFGLVASVVFSIQEQDINGGAGRWWNGARFQDLPVTLPAFLSGTIWSPAAGVGLPQLNSGQSYDLTVIATDTTSNSATATITVHAPISVLNWDPGQTALGTAVFQRPNTNGGNYWFLIIPQTPAVGVWRTALNVSAGEADVYLSEGSPPANTNSYYYGSRRVGSDGFVVDSSQFQPGQNWYLLVNASTNAQWNLVTGDAFVYPLGPLAADNSSSTNASVGAEGMLFCQTTIPSATLAWQLWLKGAGNEMFVKKSAAPDPVSYDLAQSGQMLVVPPYLAGGTFNGTYFIGVSGDPGTLIQLDSRQQPVTDLPFNSLTNLTVTATNFPYRTYRVQVPVQQIAWQLNLTPASGNPSIAVRRDLVPNEFRNDAFSETPPNVGASVTLVPPPPNSGLGVPGLSDGTFYVTIYSTSTYACGFNNANPVITDVHYLFNITNDAPTRAGWRYYRVGNIAEQLGTLGWGLVLSNQVPGSEIALRRNAVPGQWGQRTADDNYYVTLQGYVDSASSYGLLQQPGHQADIWYIGVYTPTQALGGFVLSGVQLTGQLMPFDGAGSSVIVANQPPGQWGFFRIDVPADTLGWDVRLVGVSNGSPQMVVSRDTLPTGLSSVGTWNGPYGAPGSSTSWPSGSQWVNSDWVGCGLLPLLAMGMGNPLQAGTYFIGVQDPNNVSSYTLQSRGIGLTNYAIRVKDLNINGSTNNPGLAVTEGDYYRVVVPSNAPDWKLHLQAAAGEVLLKVQKDYLPNSGRGLFGYGDVYNAYGGQLMMKPGDEQWALLPQNNNSLFEGTNLTAGTYYVLVASQGQNLTNVNCSGLGSGWGTGSVSYTLSSLVEPVVQLPDALSYSHDLLVTNAQGAGEMEFYQFNVPAGLASIEVRLENRVGNPVMYLSPGAVLGGTWAYIWPYNIDPYGNFGGTNSAWRDGNLLTVPNPKPGPYSLTVYASTDNGYSSGNPLDASYVVRVRAVPPTLVDFDGGTASVTNQAAVTWHYFQVNVPADALGWDVRLVGVSNGSPQIVVSRDTLPTGLSSGGAWNGPYGAPGSSTSWPSGSQWVNSDWVGCGLLPLLAMGMGNPLQAGTYFIGVQDPNNVSSYTLQSRGIGLTNYAIRVKDLSINGSTNNPGLAMTEADYYRVVVPSNAPDWKLHLQATAGEVLLKVQKDYLPNSGRGLFGYGDLYNAYGGQLMMKPGDEQWALLPQNNNSVFEGTNLTAGTYYVLVASQGQDLTNANCSGLGSGWGTGSASYTLSSLVEPVMQLPNALSYSHDLLVTNAQGAGEMKFYQFNVPAGLASIEVRLENRVGNPMMYLNPGAVLGGTWAYMWPYNIDPYGNFGGTNSVWRDGNLLTVPNPQPGPYSLTVYASTDNGYSSGNPLDASYVLRVRAVPPTLVGFDGGTASVTNQAAVTWHYFQVNVPADALGWDVRLVGVSNGSPQIVVSRDTLPTGLSSGGTWNGPYGAPGASTSWPSGSQWLNSDWVGCGMLPLLAMGMGNPLQAGTYFIGVQDPNNVSSYTLQSRGIGLTNYAIRVKDLGINGSTNNPGLAVAEGDYYRVVVPSNAPDWKLHLLATTGEVLLKVQKDYLPNSGRGLFGYGDLYNAYGGQLMMKPGDEQWALLPQNNNSLFEGTNLTAGTYYVLVASQGQNLTNANCSGLGSGWGTGSASYTLGSLVEPVLQLPNALSYSHDLLVTNAQGAGEMKFYQFNLPAGLASIEVRLENRVGNPMMYLNQSAVLGGTWAYIWPYNIDPYGNFGGTNAVWRDGNLLTIPNPQPGTYSLTVYASTDNGYSSGNPLDASYVLRVRAPVIPQLSFSPELNSGTLTNIGSGLLADNQRSFYQVTVPAFVAGAPVLGWKLDLAALNGTPSVRVRRNLLPDDTANDGTSPFNTVTATIVPPYLTPGNWYVEVKGTGSTTYSLTSSVITTNTLAHPLWVMPAIGQTNVAAGMALPMIGDSGIYANGNPLPGDQGIDLKQGGFDYYAVVVPTNNAAVLRTVLQAISGNPNLYLRAGAAPTLAHDPLGNGGYVYDRALTGGTTEYASWVPLNGRYEAELTNGVWIIAVQAGGNANVRYRLQLSCGNSVTNGLVQNLPLNGGSFTNQNLNGGDWRYYRVQIPSNAPANWAVTFARNLGSARMFVRDTVPPGDGAYTSPVNYANPSYNPTFQYPDSLYQDLQVWSRDQKNQGPYPRFDSPGTYSLATPPLRPGAVYYLGFWSPVDTTFSVSSATNGATLGALNTLAFFSGSFITNIPGHGTLRYRLDVPPSATRILFNASNSANVVLSLEQGTVALAGGPAHWTSYNPPSSQNNNQPNVSLNQLLGSLNNWPWLSGYTYYLTFTNTSSVAEYCGLTMGAPADLMPVSLVAPATVFYTLPNPVITVTCAVTNQGLGSATGGWYDRIWFSTNGVLDANSVVLNDVYINQTVAPGTIYSQTNAVTLPVSGTGNYTLFAQADVYDAVYELNEANNVSPPVSVRVLPPLRFNTSPGLMRWTTNGFRLQLDGLAGSGLIVYASTNLVSWTPIYTNPTATGTIQFLDSRATNFPRRFYRAVEQ